MRILSSAGLFVVASCALIWAVDLGARPWPPGIRVSNDGRGFVVEPSGRRFTPWGFNYDHDEHSRLLEEYWDTEWNKVEQDFAEMKQFGANVVRIHLQLNYFMVDAQRPNVKSLDQLSRLLLLAQRTGLYLDLTGLGCYVAEDVPAWYDALGEEQRWDVQARFWRAVAERCKDSPAIFCYDLMNEPVVPSGHREEGGWLGPPLGRFYFVQCITLDQADRPRTEITRRWIRQLTQAIRQVDQRHLVTVGMVPWSLGPEETQSGFFSRQVAAELDFVSVHIYPRLGQVEEALQTLNRFKLGKPVVIEETYALKCDSEELEQFIDESRGHAAGWIGFYWGRTPDELRRDSNFRSEKTLRWLEFFQRRAEAQKH